ncbi:MAG TPA: SIS domain-containing protein, partial [Acidobacteriota bacterium]|nr:SIS domain-containing protein [Acidobacteriota bacterium]
VKPTVEIMAALPSVVVGFIAGLWLASRVEKQIVPVLLMLVFLQVETVMAKGDDSMARVLACVALGDFVSYHLALRHKTDPSALPGVESLKRMLSA